MQAVVGTARLSSRNLRHYINVPSLVLLITLIITSYNLHETRLVHKKLAAISSIRGLGGGDGKSSVQQRGRQAWVKAKHVMFTFIRCSSFYIIF